MTYNQKAWLGVLLLCTLFWVAVIGGACVRCITGRIASMHTSRRASSPRATARPLARNPALRRRPPPRMGRDKTR